MAGLDSRNAPLNLNGNYQHAKDAEMEVEILQTIGGNPGSGYNSGPQKVLCRVVVAPLTPLHSSVPANFDTDQDQRMKIIAKLMDGTVTQEFLGLDHCEFHPKNVIASMRNLGQPLEEPRAVLVGYGRALVDDLRSEPARFWKHFPTKHHPVIRFGWQRLNPFKVWISLAWRSPEHDIDDAPVLDKWMVETFGPLTDNTEYTTFVPETLPTGAIPEKQQ
ncbi:hypothetical protein QIS74_02745 [Colletotrichum tabaci]|uniref:Uncharacterized protein n=1 Tax=Colletotrichum tabaci TaxID=1209068 RepID=A0AAV9TQR8_9PEZI